MRELKLTVLIGLLIGCHHLMGQVEGDPADSLPKVSREVNDMKAIQKRVDRAEKKAKKEERARKKAEKALRQKEKLLRMIASSEKSIKKDTRKMEKYESKLLRDQAKGKLSPVDIQRLNAKIVALRTGISKEEARLIKLRRKL